LWRNKDQLRNVKEIKINWFLAIKPKQLMNSQQAIVPGLKKKHRQKAQTMM
jgi:hypothetical protein